MIVPPVPVLSNGSTTVIVVSSGMAEVVSRALPTKSCRTAPALALRMRVPAVYGVTGTVKTPEVSVVSVTVPMVKTAVPALPKEAAETVLASMSSLKVTV